MRVAVIGSGPAGTAAGHALIDAGLHVEMLDGGNEPDTASDALSAQIREAVGSGSAPGPRIRAALKYGCDGAPSGGLVRGIATSLSGAVEGHRIEKRSLGSRFVFDGTDAGIPVVPLPIPRSLARGGLSNVWGAACYPWRADDYSYWPIAAEEMAPYYAKASEMLGLVQQEDDLSRAYPLYGSVSPTVSRNPGSAAERLLCHWARHVRSLDNKGFAAGRARVAVRAPGTAGDACRRCGLCVYGCAWDSIYSTRRTLHALERRGLHYRGGSLVMNFEDSTDGVRVRFRTGSGAVAESCYDAVFLAAGTLSSLRIAADSLGEHDRPAPLLDNGMVLLPLLLTRGVVGRHFRSRFTLAEANLAVEAGRVSDRAVHLQLYSFHEYFLAELADMISLLPRLLQDLLWWPLNNLLVSFTYTAGSESRLASGRVRRRATIGCVEVEQRENPDHAAIIRRLTRHLWQSRHDLGFWPIAPLAKLTPFGFSGHLAGSLPMRSKPAALQSDIDGRLFGTKHVYVADAAAFPDLPAQNPTYTVIANALRVADRFSSKMAR